MMIYAQGREAIKKAKLDPDGYVVWVRSWSTLEKEIVVSDWDGESLFALPVSWCPVVMSVR